MFRDLKKKNNKGFISQTSTAPPNKKTKKERQGQVCTLVRSLSLQSGERIAARDKGDDLRGGGVIPARHDSALDSGGI